MKKIAVCPGSYDPITNAHIDMAVSASHLFDHVILLICENSEKKHLISQEKRFTLAQTAIKNLKLNNVSVEKLNQKLTVNYCKSNNINIIVRGIRWYSDFEHEFSLAQANSLLAPQIETVILLNNKNRNYVSSKLVKEIAINKGDVSEFVPQCVAEHLKKYYG